MVPTVINIHLSTRSSVCDTPLTALCRDLQLWRCQGLSGAPLFYDSRWNIETYTFMFSLRYCINLSSLTNSALNVGLASLTHHIHLHLSLLQWRLKIEDSIHSEVDYSEYPAYCTGTKALLSFSILFFDPLSPMNEIPFFSIALGWQVRFSVAEISKPPTIKTKTICMAWYHWGYIFVISVN